MEIPHRTSLAGSVSTTPVPVNAKKALKNQPLTGLFGRKEYFSATDDQIRCAFALLETRGKKGSRIDALRSEFWSCTSNVGKEGTLWRLTRAFRPPG
jgi:hypothetical protein